MNLRFAVSSVVMFGIMTAISQDNPGIFVDSCCAKGLQPGRSPGPERDQPFGTAASEKTTALHERTIDLEYHFTIRDLPESAKQIDVWVPLPPSNAQQSLEDFRLDPDLPYTVLTEPEYGNQFIYLSLPQSASESARDLTATATFRINRKAYDALDDSPDGRQASPVPLARFLAPDRLVPVDGVIAREAHLVAGNLEQPLAQARRLYDHVVESMAYDKSGDGWGRGDALYACDARTGNCTDFHSLFIGEARALGIPARFIMGVPLTENSSQGVIPGYHCWAEFYVEGKGWLTVDASEASKHPEKKEQFFAGLDEHRIQFTTGRDIHLPGASAPPLNYVIYPHVEIDGRPHDNVEARFFFREIAGT